MPACNSSHRNSPPFPPTGFQLPSDYLPQEQTVNKKNPHSLGSEAVVTAHSVLHPRDNCCVSLSTHRGLSYSCPGAAMTQEAISQPCHSSLPQHCAVSALQPTFQPSCFSNNFLLQVTTASSRCWLIYKKWASLHQPYSLLTLPDSCSSSGSSIL